MQKQKSKHPPEGKLLTLPHSPGSGLLSELIAELRADNLDEILIDGSTHKWTVKSSLRTAHPAPFTCVRQFQNWIQDLAFSRGLRIDPLHPCEGGELEGGFRWHGILPPACPDGPLFSLRQHRFSTMRSANFFRDVTTKAEVRKNWVDNRPMVICGKTGTGKTTLLVALLKEWASAERVLILETLQEIPRMAPSWVRLVARAPNQEGLGGLSLELLLQNALRMLPDRIVVGEMRQREAAVFFHASQTGHAGVISTLHAATPLAAKARLTALLAESSGIQWESAAQALEQLNPTLVFLGSGGDDFSEGRTVTSVQSLH